MIKEVIKVSGMTCANCELKIENSLSKIDGISKVKASYNNSTVEVEYDETKTNLTYIKMKIATLDYQVEVETKKTSLADIFYIFIIIAGIYIILNYLGWLKYFNIFPEADSSMGYGLLFVVGLLTSIHCISMCGGINLAQSIKANKVESTFKSNLLTNFKYNLGRVISYTVIGGVIGGFGTLISFNGYARGIVSIVAGIFMIIMGLNMLNAFPSLKRFNIKMPKFITRKLKRKNNSSFYIGLINGFMPCGPLQSMQIFALSTASVVNGALAMFFFSLGTVPLMYLLGVFSSYLNKKFMKTMMSVSACLVIIFGITMFNNGSAQSGLILPIFNQSTLPVQTAMIVEDKQEVIVDLYANAYVPIKVKKDIPVSWTIKVAKENLNGCNNAIIVPYFNIEKRLIVGENIIEFTPTKTGTFSYSCWMGMIKSYIIVID